ncbi:MAG: aminotransferase [Leptothrix sp. (in: Bacteria)]|nr:aminotransferase [Leptothrix sp. (in: b-proteobacteria)]
MTTSATATPADIDLRTIAPRQRHAVVFGRLDALQAGHSLQLVNDHDPQPLRLQLDDRAFGQFEWAPLASGPAVWRVQITRVGIKPIPVAADSCCSGGACCG